MAAGKAGNAQPSCPTAPALPGSVDPSSIAGCGFLICQPRIPLPHAHRGKCSQVPVTATDVSTMGRIQMMKKKEDSQ